MPYAQATPYIGTVNNDSPLGYWPLNGDATDWSGHNNNGVINGSVAFGKPGLLSSAGDLGGTCAQVSYDNNISLPTTGLPTGANPWSIEAWCQEPTLQPTGLGTVVAFGTYASHELASLQFWASGPNYWNLSGYSADINSGANSALAATTYHLVGTYDGTHTRLYVNGALVATGAYTLNETLTFAAIGAGSNDTTDTFAGYIQHVAIYGYALSATQIRSHYVAGTQGLGTYAAVIGGLLCTVTPSTINAVNQIGQRSQGQITVMSALGIRWQYGTAFELYDNFGGRRYTGFVHKDKAYKDPGLNQGQGLLNHDLTLMDNAYRADKRVIYASYLETTAGAIAQNIIDRVLYQEGVTYTATSIATGITIPEAIWNGKQCSAAFDWLAKQAGYWWNIDINNIFWFQPYGGLPAPWSVDGTQIEGNENYYVTSGNDLYVNTQYTKGGNATKGSKSAPLVETFMGDGVTRSFTLSYPVDTIFQVLLDSVDVTASSLTKGSSGGLFYYAPGDSVIAQDPSQTVLTSSDTLQVKYDGRVPAIGKAQNSTLIAQQRAREGKGSSGIVENVYSDTKVHTLAGALQIAAALLAHFGDDATLLDFDTLQDGLMEGQTLSVNLPDFALNSQMLINSVALTDQVDGWNVWQHVQAIGSPVEAAAWQTYWQGLMDQQYDPSDLSDVNDTTLTPITVSNFSHSPSFSTTTTPVQSPICGVTSGVHTMLCGNWKPS